MGIYPGNAVLNAIFWLPAQIQYTKDLGLRDRILANATKIRESLKKLRNPGYIKDMAASLARIQSEVSWDKMGQDLPSAMEGCMIVNNLWK